MSPSPTLVRERKLDQLIAALQKRIDKVEGLIQECLDVLTTLR